MSTQQYINAIRAQRLANTLNPLALMVNTQTPFHPDQSSNITYIQHPQPNNDFVPQPSFNWNYMQQPMQNPEDCSDPTAAINTELALMAKGFKLTYSTPTNNNQRISSNPQNRQIAQSECRESSCLEGVQNPGVQNVENQNGVIVVPGIAYQNGNGNVVASRAEGNANGNNGKQIRCYNCRGLGHLARNCTVRPRRRDVTNLQTQLLIAQKKEAGIQLQAEEFDLMSAAEDLDEIDKVNANYGSAEVQLHDNCYNDEIFNIFTQEEQYTELLEPIPKPQHVLQNDSNVISEVSYVEQGGGTVEQYPINVEETRVLYDSLYGKLERGLNSLPLFN
ncbi:integrase, catalytic region, zinc finger, CCHC-type containing protein [Tanacetum coccineum]|uniref:Integrase, catalytic region, zinc finger, CCHC-type containing protein n=1 Tax=Tanacetum coccineum TaxID=301880 RepID=A0ABQ5HDN8_9ASTR